MFRFTLKNIWAHKTRLALSMVSIFLGVAFLAGTLVFTATIKNSFNDLFTSVFKKTDAVVQSNTTTTNEFGEEIPLNIPRSALGDIESVDGVKEAQGELDTPMLVVLDDEGTRMFSTQGPPIFGMSLPQSAELTQWVLVDKNDKNLSPKDTVDFELADNEVLVDKATADSKDLKVGSTIRVVAPADVRTYKVAGLVRFGTADGIGGAAAFLFNDKQITEITNQPDTYTAITIAAEDGISQEEVASKVQSVLDAKYPDKFEVSTGEELVKETQAGINEFFDFFTIFLLIFALISFMVALIIIINSFAIIMTQRKREYALMRAIGASRGQILRSVLGESVIVGLVASALGVLGGIGLAVSIKSIMDANGIKLPAGAVIVPTNAIVGGILIGTIATLCSAFFPALFASFVSPMEALRETAFEKNRRFIWRILVSVFFGAIAASIIALGFSQKGDSRIQIVGMGIAALVPFVIAVLPILVKPFTALVGSRPMGVVLILFGGRRAFGITGNIARRNNNRNRRRSARTALALFIGVALVVFITVFVSSAKATFKEYLDSTYAADVVVGDFNSPASSLTQERCDQLSDIKGIDAYSCMRFVPLNLEVVSDGESQVITSEGIVAMDTKDFSRLFDTKYEGNPNRLGNSGIILTDDYVDDNGVKIGSKIKVRGSFGEKTLTVKSILDEGVSGPGSSIIIDNETYREVEPERPFGTAMVTIKDGANVNTVVKSISKVFANTGIEVNDFKSSRDQQLASVNGPLTFVYGLLALAIIIATIGILNTMSLSILERKRELGLMRAVGTTKSQVRGFVRFESMILAVLGTTIGMIFGAGSGYLFILTLKDEGFTSFSVAPGSMLVILFVSAFVGTMAGVWPAWRATKVDVLKAITVE